MKLKRLILFIIILSFGTIFSGNLATARQIDLRAFSNTEEKIIYLTFDDGPSSIVTNDILNILKQQQVKATFFVVGNRIPGKEAILKRMYNEGHSIGLHTFSHKYEQIYASQDAFIDEMHKTSYEIKKVIGIQPRIIRFPYGSNSHLNNAFLKKLHSNNFKVYDWNASISDGVYPDIAPETFVREAVATGNGIPYVVFLMHCNNINVNTYKALPQIIQHYKRLGYQFKTITNDTPEFYWHPAN